MLILKQYFLSWNVKATFLFHNNLIKMSLNKVRKQIQAQIKPDTSSFYFLKKVPLPQTIHFLLIPFFLSNYKGNACSTQLKLLSGNIFVYPRLFYSGRKYVRMLFCNHCLKRAQIWHSATSFFLFYLSIKVDIQHYFILVLGVCIVVRQLYHLQSDPPIS